MKKIDLVVKNLEGREVLQDQKGLEENTLQMREKQLFSGLEKVQCGFH